MIENPMPVQEASSTESLKRKSRRGPLSRREKGLFITTGVIGVALLVLPLWWRSINLDPSVQIPARTLPNPNAFDFYARAANLQVAAKPAVDEVHDTQANLTPQERKIKYSLANKDAWLKRNAPALQTLRQGFAFPYEEPPKGEKLFSVAPYGRYRELARTLTVESHARAEHGDWNGAANSALDILRLGNDVPRGGPLIAGLVGYAIQAIGRRPLWNALPHLNAAQAKAAGARMQQLYDTRVPFADVIQEEKWFGQASLLQTMRDGSFRRINNNEWIGVEPELPVPLRKRILLQTISKRTVMDNYTRYMDASIAGARLPYAAPHPKLPLPDDPINKVMLPVFERAGWNAARSETLNVLLFVSLELRAYKLEHGAYPQTLQELVPAYLPRVPQDPFGAGQALRYRRIGDRYLLWSVGPDGKDDGGRAILNANKAGRNKTLVNNDSQGDVVADVNR